MNIKRYHLFQHRNLLKDENGEWVKYSDHCRAIEEYKKICEERLKNIDQCIDIINEYKKIVDKHFAEK